jgi:DHA1 family inner membrane transport protein
MMGAEADRQWRLRAGAAAATCIGNLSWWMQPQIIHDVLDRYHRSESAAGFVVTAEIAVLALSSFAVARLARGASFMVICLTAAPVVLGGALASLYTDSYVGLLLARALTGLGEGAFLMVSAAAVVHLSNPVRAYGQLLAVNIGVGAAMNLSLPAIAGWSGGGMLSLRVLLVLLVVLIPITLLSPRMNRYASPAGETSAAVSAMWIAGLASAVFLVMLACSAVWSFSVVIGLRDGLSMSDIDAVIGYAALSGLPGSIVATVIGTRLGRLPCIIIGMIVLVVAIFALTTLTSPAMFRVATCLNVAGAYFLIPYFLGFAASEDATGHAAAVAGGALLMTGAVGPYLGGLLMERAGTGSIAWFTLVAVVVATGLLIWLERVGQMRRESTHGSGGAAAGAST